MTWEDWHTARQVLVEEFVGVPQRAARRLEDEQAERTKDAIRRVERMENIA